MTPENHKLLMDKIDAMAKTINEKLFEQLKDYPMARFTGRVDSLQEWLDITKYPETH